MMKATTKTTVVKQGNCFLILPDEIVLYLFSFLRVRELCALGQASRRLHQLSNDDSLWRRLFEAFHFSSSSSSAAAASSCSRHYHSSSSSSPLHEERGGGEEEEKVLSFKTAFAQKHRSVERWTRQPVRYQVLNCGEVSGVVFDLHLDAEKLIAGGSLWYSGNTSWVRTWKLSNGDEGDGSACEEEATPQAPVHAFDPGHRVFRLLSHEDRIITASRYPADRERGFIRVFRTDDAFRESLARGKPLKAKAGVPPWTPLSILNGHTSGVQDMLYDGHSTLITSSEDWSVKLWDLTAERCTGTIHGKQKIIGCMDVDFGSNRLVCGSWDRSVWLYDLRMASNSEEGTEGGGGSPAVRQFVGHTHAVTALQFEGDALITAADDRKLIRFDMASGEEERSVDLRELTNEFDVGLPVVASLRFDDEKLLTAFVSGEPVVWDLASLTPIRALHYNNYDDEEGSPVEKQTTKKKKNKVRKEEKEKEEKGKEEKEVGREVYGKMWGVHTIHYCGDTVVQAREKEYRYLLDMWKVGQRRTRRRKDDHKDKERHKKKKKNKEKKHK